MVFFTHTHRKKSIRKFRIHRQLTGFLLGNFYRSGTESRIHERRCKICFTLKVGSHNSYNTTSSQPKMEKTNIDSEQSSLSNFFLLCVYVSSFLLAIERANARMLKWQGRRKKIINISKLPKTLSLIVSEAFFIVS